MTKIGSAVVVTGLTLGALGTVGALAYQAEGTAPRAASTRPATSHAPSAAPHGPAASERAAPLPPGSGTGTRVVYALGARRVWLVDPSRTDPVVRTFTVQPSTVDPSPGTYVVRSRTAAVTGSDGRPIEHVVLFAEQGGTPIGFSAAVDGSTPKPDPRVRTGGIRQARADGLAMWRFAPLGAKVVVLP